MVGRRDSENEVMRLQSFMNKHRLGRPAMAEILRTPPATLDAWLDDKAAAPNCLLPLLDLLDNSSHVRMRLGVCERQQQSLSHGRSSIRGIVQDSYDRRIEDALALARAI
jgi:hypothetical protein